MQTSLYALSVQLHVIASRAEKYRREQFLEREADLDSLNTEILKTIEAQMLREGPIPQLAALYQQAEKIKDSLEEQQTVFCQYLWTQVGNAPEPVSTFQAQLMHYTAWPVPRTVRQQKHLETFLMRYLIPWPIPEPTLERERGMVGYHPTPFRILLELCKQAEFQRDDVFYDIGAGLGHVALLVHLLTGIRTRGVEIDPAYCHLRQAMQLSGVEFLKTDARDVDYAGSSVFFLYTPFQGTLLHTVLQKIRRNTQGHPIRLYTLGFGAATGMRIAYTNWQSFGKAEGL